MFEKILINVSRDLKWNLYLGTSFIFDEGLIIGDGGSRTNYIPEMHMTFQVFCHLMVMIITNNT
jgi:hypothetical protein